MFIYERFEALRAAKGITKKYIATAINRNPTICQDWKQKKSEPNEAQILIISDILGTTPEYLMGQTDEPTPPPSETIPPIMSDDFTVAMHGYSKDLSPTNKLALLHMAEQLAEAERERKHGKADRNI